MANFYEISDATKPVKAGGFTFEFKQVEFFMSKWYGVLQVDDPDAVQALEAVAAANGVRPITEEEYLRKAEKKRPANASSTIRPWNASSSQTVETTGRVAADPKPAASKPPPEVKPQDLEDVLTPKAVNVPTGEENQEADPETETQLEQTPDEPAPRPTRRKSPRRRPRDPLAQPPGETE